MKIALVHDYLVQYGGAERVLEAFLELFPYAPVFTLVYDKDATHGIFEKYDIRPSYLQSMPFTRRQHRLFPPFMPQAIEQFDFSSYDIVLSDSSSFAKGIITRPETLHVSYVHTPMRYAWDDCQKYMNDFGFPGVIKKFVPFIMNPIRLWDYISSQRVDHFVANSQFVARRIKKYYNADATVIHPPVDISRFSLSDQIEDYFLMAGRLIAYKRHDIAIDAFNTLGIPLKIIGRGPELARLQRRAGKNIEFLGRVTDEELSHYYARCRGFVFPQEEDFGIVAIEALASGRPLIAYRGGDIVEHVKENISGIFFDEQTPDAIVKAVKKFLTSTFDSQSIHDSILQFDTAHFKTSMMDYLVKVLRAHQKNL